MVGTPSSHLPEQRHRTQGWDVSRIHGHARAWPIEAIVFSRRGPDGGQTGSADVLELGRGYPGGRRAAMGADRRRAMAAIEVGSRHAGRR